MALAHEIELIRILGRQATGGPLINQTEGGEGMAGYMASLETRARMSLGQRISRSRRVRPRKKTAKMRASMHMQGPRSTNTTGYKGVSPYAAGKWVAKLHIAGKSRHIGLYNSPEDAARAYDAAAIKAWGAGNCYLNLLGDDSKAA